MHSLSTLPNGIRVITVPIPGTKAVTVVAGLKVGSRYETKAQNGMAHFHEHLLFDGTPSRPNPKVLAEEVENMGADYNLYTSSEETVFYIKCAGEHLGNATAVIADCILNSKFEENEVKKEAGVITQEIMRRNDSPEDLVFEVFQRLIYGDVPLGRATLGTVENVQSFTREDVLAFRDDFLSSDALVVAFAGAVDEKEAVKAVETNFVLPQKTQKKTREATQIIQDKPRVSILTKETEQSHLVLGFEGLSYTDPDRTALRLLTAILGNGMSSRLFLTIREKRGLCYVIGAYSSTYTDVGAMMAFAGLETEKLDEAIVAILDEFRLMRDERVSEEELQKAKNYLTGRLILRFEDSSDVAEYYMSKLLVEEKIETEEEMIRRIKAVTVEDVQRVAKRLIRQDRINLAIVGPHQDEEHFLQLLANQLSS